MTEDKKKGNEIPKEQLEQVNGGTGGSTNPKEVEKPAPEHVVVDETPSGGSVYLP